MRQALYVACMLAGSAGTAQAEQSVRFDAFNSSDADDTEITKAGIGYDFVHHGVDRYQGIRIEQAIFQPEGGEKYRDQRLYYRFAGGDAWKWEGMLGTDGDTWLGNASIHSEDRFRQEYFVEREVVETRMGLERGLHHTLLGAAYDLPINDRNVVTLEGAEQDFSGDNTRTLLRGRYTWVAREDWGLSAQLRTRYFTSSDPNEFDYYSPDWYAEVIPTLQLRRFRGGWMYLAAAGVGRQRDSETDWRSARFFEAAIRSPQAGRDWFFQARVLHTNTASNAGAGDGYDYTQLMLEYNRQF